MSEVDSSLVKQGFWVDWSKGAVFGATLTTDQDKANLVIALLAILVSLAASHLWNLLMFASHQFRARKQFADGLYRQQQVLYRSMGTPGSFMFDSVILALRWRNVAEKPFLRNLGPGLLALSFGLGSLASGVFSNNIVDSSTLTVLVDGQNCTGTSTDVLAYNLYSPYWNAVYNKAASYTQNCYMDSSTPSSCDIYVQPRIPFSTEHVPCPFAETICLGHGNTAVAHDTGLLDSRDILGINVPASDRVKFRKRTTCVPLQVASRLTVMDSVDADVADIPRHVLPGEQAYKYFYGPLSTLMGDKNLTYTFSYSTYTANVTETFTTLWVFESADPTQDSDFIPIDSLKHNQSDLTLVLLATNNVLSFNPIYDPVYSFTTPTNSSCLRSSVCPTGFQSYFRADLPAGALGCLEQYQYCIHSASTGMTCTDLNGWGLDNFEAAFPQATNVQKATVELIKLATFGFSISSAAGQDPVLLASDANQAEGRLNGLANNQWELDFRLWESFVWACIQKMITDHAIGFGQQGLDQDLLHTNLTAGEKKICASQKMVKQGGFANISVFGLAFVIAIWTSLCLTETLFLKILVFRRPLRRHLAPLISQWFQEGVLQLQRRVYQDQGYGEWTNTDTDVPRTKSQSVLPNLTNLRHQAVASQTPGTSKTPSTSVSTVTTKTCEPKTANIAVNSTSPVPAVTTKARDSKTANAIIVNNTGQVSTSDIESNPSHTSNSGKEQST